MLNVISGRLKPDSGNVTFNGSDFTKRARRRLAFVQQQDVFFTHLTVWETLYVSFISARVIFSSKYSKSFITRTLEYLLLSLKISMA